jgi:hypothetical protein
MAAGLQPTVKFFVVDEQDAVAFRMKHPRRAGDVASERGALPECVVAQQKILDLPPECRFFGEVILMLGQQVEQVLFFLA